MHTKTVGKKIHIIQANLHFGSKRHLRVQSKSLSRWNLITYPLRRLTSWKRCKTRTLADFMSVTDGFAAEALFNQGDWTRLSRKEVYLVVHLRILLYIWRRNFSSGFHRFRGWSGEFTCAPPQLMGWADPRLNYPRGSVRTSNFEHRWLAHQWILVRHEFLHFVLDLMMT